jgi:hypothetical protein
VSKCNFYSIWFVHYLCHYFFFWITVVNACSSSCHIAQKEYLTYNVLCCFEIVSTLCENVNMVYLLCFNLFGCLESSCLVMGSMILNISYLGLSLTTSVTWGAVWGQVYVNRFWTCGKSFFSTLNLSTSFGLSHHGYT